MDLDRPLGCAELRSNLFVQHAGNYAFEHVKLAWCERCQSITRLLALRTLEPLLGRPCESPLNGAQEIFVSEGFRQIIDRAGFHRLYTSRHAGTARNENIAITREKDNRNLNVLAGQFLLQIKTTYSR